MSPDVASVHAAADRILDAWGGFDLALVVAGTHEEMRGRVGRDSETPGTNRSGTSPGPAGCWRSTCHGVLNCVDAILPVLERQGKRRASASFRRWPGYVAAAEGAHLRRQQGGAADQLHRVAVRGTCGPQGIGVYLINPGFVDTPLTRKKPVHRCRRLMKAEDAARVTLDEIAAGAFEIHYPKRFTAC